jgi:hypothetical protein
VRVVTKSQRAKIDCDSGLIRTQHVASMGRLASELDSAVDSARALCAEGALGTGENGL